jgi:DNA-binding LytR/AlgR family response regulator
MYHIAVVEDDAATRAEVLGFLDRYGQEQPIQATAFADGAEILAKYTPRFDVILLDIEMPQVNGMETARRIRQMDPEVVLVFLTNMATYAIQGYEVGAMDFLLKPIQYDAFAMKLGRVLKRVRQKGEKQILLTLPGGAKKLALRQIYYVEVQNRMLHYHTDQGEYVMRGTMQSVEQQLSPYPFVKCNHWYVVNLMHVTEVRKNIVVVGGHELEISRRNRTAFLRALTEYIGEAPG